MTTVLTNKIPERVCRAVAAAAVLARSRGDETSTKAVQPGETGQLSSSPSYLSLHSADHVPMGAKHKAYTNVQMQNSEIKAEPTAGEFGTKPIPPITKFNPARIKGPPSTSVRRPTFSTK